MLLTFIKKINRVSSKTYAVNKYKKQSIHQKMYIPQLSSSSARGQSSNPSQTELCGIQEPSPQVKSIGGQGAKPAVASYNKSMPLVSASQFICTCYFILYIKYAFN